MKVWAAVFGVTIMALCQPVEASPVPPVAALEPIPAYIVADSTSGQILAARRPDLRFVPASLVKVMTAYTAFDEIAAGRLDPARTLIVSPATFARWSGKGTSLYLRVGEAVSVDVLIHGITTVSANDGAAVLAQGASGNIRDWTNLMNATARRLGMTNSYFATPNGWPDNGATYVTARDLMTLGRALVTRHPALYARYFGKKSFTWNGIEQRNRDPAIGVVAGADGIKTGYTREAGYGYLGSARRGDRRVIVVVAGAPSEAARASAARAALEWSFDAWRSVPAFSADQNVARAKVQGGTSPDVAVRVARPLSVAIPVEGLPSSVRLQLAYRGPVQAPVMKGQAIGVLTVSGVGAEPLRVPVVAAEAVSEARLFDRLRNGLTGLLR